MKKLVKYSLPGIVFLSTIVPALAETEARTDNSMMLAYIFLAVCGLIIVLQVISKR